MHPRLQTSLLKLILMRGFPGPGGFRSWIDSGDMKLKVPIWLSTITLVLSDITDEAIPKSISFSLPATRRKFAGFKSCKIISAHLNCESPATHLMDDASLVDHRDCVQHLCPIELDHGGRDFLHRINCKAANPACVQSLY